MAKTRTLDPEEISRFSKDAPQWWNESGPFAPLHRLNPARLHYIKSALCRHYGRNEKDFSSLSGLKILDVGCGGGLVCEPLARLGAEMTGIDGDAIAISVAQDHAARAGLTPSYRTCTTDDLLPENENLFDAVLALEVVEHITNIEPFVKSCVDLCKPGGVVIFSTLNRTLKSFMLGKITAEYILRWVPAGTHHWRKFIRPAALSAALRAAGATPSEAKGLVFNPLSNRFVLSDSDLDVNYFIVATRDQLS